MQISFAADPLDMIKGNTDFPPSISKQEKNLDLYETQLDEEQANLNLLMHTNQFLSESFSEKFQQVTQYLYDLVFDPFGFKDVFKDISFN
jgi:hypothetical protein